MQGPVVPVKPQADIYTLLLIIAVVVLIVTIGVVLHNLMGSEGYGLSLGDLFKPHEIPAVK
ncbi:MAG TPA: hypothetical protein DCX07_00595 [Phycisphaerales bacterium]|nr:hypothetical protein [Phycisphaerales bacterium]